MRRLPAPGGRRKWSAAFTLAAAALVVGLPAVAATPPTISGDPGADSLLVRFRPGVAEAAAGVVVDAAGALVGDAIAGTGFVEISTDGQPADEVRRALLASGLVDTVEPNRERRSLAVPADPLYNSHQAGYLSSAGFPRAWDINTGADNLVLAVIDSGVDRNHPDLAGRLLTGRDIVNSDFDPTDDEGHGTMVTGVAGARTNNSAGVAGATWRGRILPVKVLDDGVAFDDDIAAGIIWAVNQGADVINLSLGGPGESSVLQAAVDYATARDVVVVSAAGNLQTGDLAVEHYPAACDGVIAVGAVDGANNLASFSNFGSWVDLVAPGVGITTTAPAPGANEAYASVAGTSFAAPLVAGAALLLKADDPTATVATITDRLRRSARDLGTPGTDIRFGAGLLDAGAALRLSSGSSAGTTPGPGTATQVRSGYWTVSADGQVFDFGDASPFGDASTLLSQAAVDIEAAPGGAGYWIVDRHGAVFTFGTATYHGGLSMANLRPGETVTSISSTPGGTGYWLFTTTGRVFPFGDAVFFGDLAAVALNAPVLDSVPTPTGEGYYMVAADGGIFTFGDALFAGSTGGLPLNAPVQSLVPDPDGSGYWLVASDGGVFTFDSVFRGSLGSIRLNQPVTGMVAFGDGYLMVAEDGGIFNFSNLPFSGSLGGAVLSSPVVAMAALPR
ncbi:MAG: S8 family serine peptidase [Acidimicrobiia bacterium]